MTKPKYAFVSTTCSKIPQEISDMAEKGYSVIAVYPESFINVTGAATFTGFYNIVFEHPYTMKLKRPN
jgi:hypothetical protein